MNRARITLAMGAILGFAVTVSVSGLLSLKNKIAVGEDVSSTIEAARETEPSHRQPASVSPSKSLSDSGQSKSQIRSEIAQIDAEMDALTRCWKEDSCENDPNDPRASHFAASQGIRERLLRLLDLKKRDSGLELSRYARQYLKFPDDYVREAALELALVHEQSDQNLQAILSGLSATISVPLVEKAIPVLEGYSKAGYSSQVQTFVESVLRSGPLGVAETVAEEATRFLDSGSLGRFRSLASELPSRSRSRRSLESAIREFEKRQSGG